MTNGKEKIELVEIQVEAMLRQTKKQFELMEQGRDLYDSKARIEALEDVLQVIRKVR